MNTLENGTCQKENTTIYEECACAKWRVQRFNQIAGRNGKTTVAFEDFVKTITTRNACFSAPNMDIDEVRAMPKDARARVKTQAVYAYCLQSRNATKTKQAELEDRDLNDLVCLDFDCDSYGEYLTAKTAPAIRDKCAQSPACVFSALSISGAGAFAVFRVYGGFWADMLHNGSDYRKKRMTALFDLMRRELGVGAVCDDACKDATRLRAASFDAQAFYNPECGHHISKVAIDAEIFRLNAVCARLNAAPKSSDDVPNSDAKSPYGLSIIEAERAFDAEKAQLSKDAERVLLMSQNRVTICASRAKALEALAKLASLKRNSGAGVHTKVYGAALNLYERCFAAMEFDCAEIEAMVVDACKRNGEYQERPNDVLESIRSARKDAECKVAAKRAQAQAKREQAQASANAEMQFLAPYWERLRYDTFADNYQDMETGERHNIDYVGAWIARDLTAFSGKYVWIAKGIDLVVANVRRVPERCFDGLLERAQELASEGECGAIDDYCARCGFDAYEARRLRLWLYQLAARAFIPGEKTDNILIFASRLQGIGKTWFCDKTSQALCNHNAYEYDLSAGKDARIMMSRATVARFDEFDRMTRKSDLATLKALMTNNSSNERAPYAHSSEERLYRAVLVGTTNKEDIIPEGEEMARRYWIIKPRKDMYLTFDEARALVSEACADVMACISKETYDAFDARTKIWLETAQEIEENTRRNSHHKDHGNATNAIIIGVKLIRAIAQRTKSYVGFGRQWNVDDTRCLGAKEWAAIFTTGDTTLLGGGDERFTPIKAGVREVANLITQRVKRTKDKYRNNGYCLRDIEAAVQDMECDEIANDNQETPAQETPAQEAPATDDRCYDTPYTAQASYGNVAFDTSNEEYRKYVEQQNNVTLTQYTPDMF